MKNYGFIWTGKELISSEDEHWPFLVYWIKWAQEEYTKSIRPTHERKPSEKPALPFLIRCPKGMSENHWYRYVKPYVYDLFVVVWWMLEANDYEEAYNKVLKNIFGEEES